MRKHCTGGRAGSNAALICLHCAAAAGAEWRVQYVTTAAWRWHQSHPVPYLWRASALIAKEGNCFTKFVARSFVNFFLAKESKNLQSLELMDVCRYVSTCQRCFFPAHITNCHNFAFVTSKYRLLFGSEMRLRGFKSLSHEYKKVKKLELMDDCREISAYLKCFAY